MNKKPTIVLMMVLVMSGLVFHSCYYDNAEELFVCFPEDVSYREDVVPILQTRCYECHDITNAPALGDGIVLEGYGRLFSYLDGNESKFIGAVKWNGEGTPMPPNGSRMNNCSASKLEVWIEEGMRNN